MTFMNVLHTFSSRNYKFFETSDYCKFRDTRLLFYQIAKSSRTYIIMRHVRPRDGQIQSKEFAGSHRAADGWALRQFIRTTPQVSSAQGKSLYATLILAVFEVAFLVPG